jgi:hypothetical protein
VHQRRSPGARGPARLTVHDRQSGGRARPAAPAAARSHQRAALARLRRAAGRAPARDLRPRRSRARPAKAWVTAITDESDDPWNETRPVGSMT